MIWQVASKREHPCGERLTERRTGELLPPAASVKGLTTDVRREGSRSICHPEKQARPHRRPTLPSREHYLASPPPAKEPSQGTGIRGARHPDRRLERHSGTRSSHPIQGNSPEHAFEFTPAPALDVQKAEKDPLGHPEDKCRFRVQPPRSLDLHAPRNAANAPERQRLRLEDALQPGEALHEQVLEVGSLAHSDVLSYGKPRPCLPNAPSPGPSRSW